MNVVPLVQMNGLGAPTSQLAPTSSLFSLITALLPQGLSTNLAMLGPHCGAAWHWELWNSPPIAPGCLYLWYAAQG